MQSQNKKKGFTLVELLVVIAILAVLATVSVVGYMGFTKKAQESNDVSLTTQMNTVLQANGAVEHNKTLSEVKEDLLEAGIDLEKVTPNVDGYSYVWDSKQDLMFLLNENKEVVAPTNATMSNKLNVFVLVKNETEFNNFNGYSKYLKSGFQMSESSTLFNELKTGLDVGNNTIEEITYKGSDTKEAIIRTNGGRLNIDAGSDTVYHYGASNYVNIVAINSESYHEFGSTVYARIAQGHFVAEDTAKVINLNVANSSVTITEESGSNVVGYSKSSNDVTVKVNGSEKEVTDVKTKEEIEDVANKGDVVADGGEVEINGISVKTLKSAIDMAMGGETIKLINNCLTEEQIILNKNITLDFNGFNIENIVDLWDIANSTILIEDCSVTLMDSSSNTKGGVRAKKDDCYAINVKNADVEVLSGTYIGNVSVFQLQTGTLKIKGGYFDLDQKWDGKYTYEINCIDEAFADKSAVVEISGGSFVGFNPLRGPEKDNPSFVVDGYNVVETKLTSINETLYTVVKE